MKPRLKAPDRAKAEKKAALKPLHYHIASDVEPLPVHWLWRPYIPRGVITTLEGQGGMGKSFISCAIAAAVSNGEPLPGQQMYREPRRVLMLSAEDDMSRVIRPRLDALNADTDNIALIPEAFTFDHDTIQRLDLTVKGFAATIVFIDPILSYTGGKLDINKGNDVRHGLMDPLKHIADKHNCAMIVVRHFGKSKKSAQNQGLGSVDFTNAARSQLQVRQWDDGSRTLMHTKTNYGEMGKMIEYTILPGEWDPIAEIEGPATLVWGDIREEVEKPLVLSKRKQAENWLKDILQSGPIPSSMLAERAKEDDISMKTIKRAKRGLAESVKLKDGTWEWRLL